MKNILYNVIVVCALHIVAFMVWALTEGRLFACLFGGSVASILYLIVINAYDNYYAKWVDEDRERLQDKILYREERKQRYL